MLGKGLGPTHMHLMWPLQLEDAQGQPDEEAQQLLKTLQERMGALENAREANACRHDAITSRSGPSDVEIASSIDRCVCCMQHCLQSSHVLAAEFKACSTGMHRHTIPCD